MVKHVRDHAWREPVDAYLARIGFTEPPRYYTRRIVTDTLIELAKADPRIVFVGADFNPESYLAEGIHPYRVINFGIDEANTAVAASGLAKEGLIPVWSMMSWLLGRAYNQIFQSIATDNHNVKLLVTARGWAGGGSHHEINDIAFMRCIPQMLCMAPADPVELRKMLVAALKYHGATFVRIYGQPVPNLFEEDYPFTIDRAFTVREGADVSILSFGTELWRSLTAADRLAEDGIDARVINMSTLKPLDDEAILTAAKETGALVTAEDHSIIGGLGEAIAAVLSEHRPTPMVRIGVRDRYSQSTYDKPGGWTVLEASYHLAEADIAAAAKRVLTLKG